MDQQRTPGNFNHRQTPAVDWHRADVIAAIKKADTSMSAIEHENGYAPGSLSMVFKKKHWPNAEVVIASAISKRGARVYPWDIWPSRWERRNGKWQPRGGVLTLNSIAGQKRACNV